MPDVSTILDQITALRARRGTQIFFGQSDNSVAAAFDAQIDVLQTQPTEAALRAKYESGDDFVLGMALTAWGWLNGQNAAPVKHWPNHFSIEETTPPVPT